MAEIAAPQPSQRFSLEAKTAIITGASKGIGEAVALGLAACGAQVVVSSRKQPAVDAVAARFRKAGHQAIAVAAHVGKPEDRRRLVERTVEAFGGIDILINNAATNPVYGPVMTAGPEAFAKIFEVNVNGAFELCRLVHPILTARGGGSIINMGSIAGISPMAGLGLYSISKFAVIGLTKVLAKEWGDQRIRVNAICPGLIKTAFSTALWQDDRIRAHFEKQNPMHRIGAPEDVVGLAIFLASEAAAYCTGGVYVVDGGETI